MKLLHVWVNREDGTYALAGELATSDPVAGGRFESEFEYSPEWTAHPAGFDLDPASLPRLPRGQRFRAAQFDPPLSVIDDALPDDWGRRLLSQALRLAGRKPVPAEMLVNMRGGGTGALVFTEQNDAPQTRATLGTRTLSSLLSSATRFESGTLPANDEFRKLLEGSSRAGGARPKALVHDDDGEWIAKFPSASRDGAYDVVGLEAVCLELAQRAGLPVPKSRLQNVGRKRVLLVRRFDVTPQGGRVHMVSMRTICKERPGLFVTSYSDMARALGKFSAAPAADVAMLFRHMTFNAAIGNVDDHLKNFWMLGSRAGFRLAPAFDLTPDVSGRGEHTLSFQYGMTCPTRDALCEVADHWAVPDAAGLIDEVCDAVSQFAAIARRVDVRGGKSVDVVKADIRQRLTLLKRAR